MVLFLCGGGEGGKVLSAGSLDCGLIDGDNGSVGVGNKTGITNSVGGSGIAVTSCVTGKTSSGQVLSTGSLDCGLIDGDNSSIGVGNEGWCISNWVVKVVVGQGLGIGSGVSCGVGISVVDSGISVVTVVSSGVSGVSSGISVVCSGVSSVSSISGVSSGVCGKVSSLGSLDLRGLDGGDGTVGVFDKLGAGSSHASKENLKRGKIILIKLF
jgi:hypothetical protein